MDARSLAARFPSGFLFGAATSAYQVEGAVDADGRGESIWDVFVRRPGAIRGGDTGERACDAYRRWREDVALLARLGVSAYRFEIAWPRVLPEGIGRLEPRGLDHYARLVDALLERGITPFPTLYHWSLPQALEERGGWMSPEAPGWFSEFVEAVLDRLADRVPGWLPVNEPAVSAFLGYARSVHAPGRVGWESGLVAAHRLLAAHGTAAELIRARGCAAGIALNLYPCPPLSDDPADVEAARRLDGHENRWFLDPVFGRGYPADMLARWGPRFPAALAAEAEGWERQLDFLGVNYYGPHPVRAAPGENALELEIVPAGERTGLGWSVDPGGLYETLARVQRDYGPLPLYVTENGAAYDDRPEADGYVDDRERLSYLARHLEAAAEALAAAVDLRGFFVWSLLDNFEWQEGYAARFGIVYVDYATQRRTPKASGRFYAELLHQWRLRSRDEVVDRTAARRP